ncbi:MAG TPA: pilus assembly protein TadG-related protein [Polyangia bacterium]|nr:pilus assembly protein TadG-related protein [Polyangia bacterium]
MHHPHEPIAKKPPRNPERGAMAVLMGFSLTMIMAFAAMGFDMAYVRVAREEMQNAVDAAAHAASITLAMTNDTTQATAAAQTIASKNTVLGIPVSLNTSDIVFGSYDFSTKLFVAGGTPTRGVQIVGSHLSNTSGKVDLTFGRILGQATANVQHSVTATYAARYFQVEMQISDDYICDIDNAADAAVQLLTYINGAGGTPADYIGLDMFTGNTKQLTGLMNVRMNYATNIYPVWKPDFSTLGVKQSAGGGTTPPQTKGIAVCSKANAPTFPFAGPPALAAVPGGYRQCPPVNKVGVLPTSEQYAFPNHSWVQYCSDGGPSGLYAGTDLGAAIHDGVAKLVAADPPTTNPYDSRTLILIADGTPMACTGIGGGSLCGHTYGGDGVTPPPGKSSSDPWDPCCANALTCGGTHYTYKGVNYGGGAWGDGNPGASPNGATACTAAQTLLKKAIDEADIATDSSHMVDIYVVGFYGNDPTSVSAAFGTGLARGRGTGVTTGDSTQFATLLKAIPARVPVSLVK